MAKSKKYSVKQIVLSSVIAIALVMTIVGLCLSFLLFDAKILKDFTIGLFEFEGGLGVTTIVFAIIALLLVIATVVLTALKFTKYKVPRIAEIIVYIATIVFAALVLILTMSYCADISEPLVNVGTGTYTLTTGAFMFPIAGVIAGAVALGNK